MTPEEAQQKREQLMLEGAEVEVREAEANLELAEIALEKAKLGKRGLDLQIEVNIAKRKEAAEAQIAEAQAERDDMKSVMKD